MDVVVIGAGQAGLSSAYFLRRAGLEFVVLDHASGPGGAWQHRWPTLTMATVHGINALPGMPLGEPQAERRAAEVLPEYFAAYEDHYALPIRRPVHVRKVREHGDGRLAVETDEGVWITQTVINATGTWERPFWPRVPGQETFRGRQLHTAGYRGPEEFRGRHVVVVGGGASATQHLLELQEVTTVSWVTRSEPFFYEGPFDAERGPAVVAEIADRVQRGLPPGSIASATGLPRTPELAAFAARRLPMFDRITPSGVAWDDGRELAADVIVWATGFRAALDHLAPLRLREPGGGIRVEGTRVVKDPRVHLAGYGPSASTIGANRAGRVAVREIRRLLAGRDAIPA